MTTTPPNPFSRDMEIEDSGGAAVTPHSIALDITDRIRFGEIIESGLDGHVIKLLRKAIFEAARSEIAEQLADGRTNEIFRTKEGQP